MGWVDALDGQVIGLDTAPLIYYIEENEAYLPVIEPFFDALETGIFSVVTSTLTIIETLILPLRQQNESLANQYQQILTQSVNLTLVPTTVVIAQKAAELRAVHNIRTPDAIQLATAIERNASAFLTNDTGLKRVSEIQVLILDELV